MEKGIWLAIILGTIFVTASYSNAEYALGYTLAWFLAGLILSPIARLTSKIWSKARWKWFHWLNAAAFMMLALFLVKPIIETEVETLIKEKQSTPRQPQPSSNTEQFRRNYYPDCVREATSGSDGLIPSVANPLCDCITNRLISSLPPNELDAIETTPYKHIQLVEKIADKCAEAVLSGNYSPPSHAPASVENRTNTTVSKPFQIRFQNQCDHKIELAVGYTSVRGQFVALKGWEFGKSAPAFLSDGEGNRLESKDRAVWIHARTTDGSNFVWRGERNVDIASTRYPMQKIILSENDPTIRLECQ